MHILFTRPLEDSHEMILKFQSLGHNVSHLPLIEIEGIKINLVNFSDFKGIIFTSSNAIKYLDIKNIRTAPVVAPILTKRVPKIGPNKKPPVIVKTDAPGIDRATDII